MNKTIYVALFAALIGLTACGNRSRKVANAVGDAATAIVEKPAQAVAAAATAVATTAEQAVEADSLKARFQGSDGTTKRVYWVDAVFYPKTFKAKISVDGKVYHLEEYRTADGFGYRNAEVDLRGKGDEADLTYTDTKIRPLKLKAVNE